MEKSKVIATLMLTSCNLDNDKNVKPIEERKYQGMIGFLLYLIVSNPNIMFVVCVRACFQVP